MSDEPTASPDDDLDPASAAAPPSRRSALLRSGLIVGVLVVVFGIILPQFIDYSDVAAAFRDLTLQQVLLMTALGIVAWVASGLIFAALIEGMSWIRGTMSWLILGGIGASVPFGPWNMGVLWVVVRGWGVETAPATAGVALYGVVNMVSRLPLPLIGFLALTASGELAAVGGSADAARTIAILSAVAFVVVTGLIVGIVRSERIADRIGRTAQGITDWVMRRLGRDGSPDVASAIHKFRDQLGVVIQRRGLRALVVAIVAQFAWVLVLLVGLRTVGVPEDVLSNAEILAVYGLVMVITIIPLSPGGAGVSELLFISAFSALAPGYEAAITAGVFLYRIYFWFVPIPIAWILLKVVRRGRSMLPTTAELKGYASDSPA